MAKIKINWWAFSGFIWQVVAMSRIWFNDASRDGVIDETEIADFVAQIGKLAEQQFNPDS